MTTSNKSDSLQRPEGRGFSPTLLIRKVWSYTIIVETDYPEMIGKDMVSAIKTGNVRFFRADSFDGLKNALKERYGETVNTKPASHQADKPQASGKPVASAKANDDPYDQ